MASRCVFSTAVAYALSKVGKEGLVLKKEQLQTIRNLYNILSLLDSCTEQFYGTCTEIFHACANSVYTRPLPSFGRGLGTRLGQYIYMTIKQGKDIHPGQPSLFSKKKLP